MLLKTRMARLMRGHWLSARLPVRPSRRLNLKIAVQQRSNEVTKLSENKLGGKSMATFLTSQVTSRLPQDLSVFVALFLVGAQIRQGLDKGLRDY